MSFALTFFAAAALAGGVHHDMLVSTQWLADHLNDPNVIVLEVGAQAAPSSATLIPGARFLPITAICKTVHGIPNELPPAEVLQAEFRDLGIGNDAKVVIYGDTPLLAARAWFTLDYLGHGDRAAILDGGFAKWRAEKRPGSADRFARGKLRPTYKPAPFDVKIDPAKLVSLDTVKHVVSEPTLDGKKVVFVDARPTEQFTGKQKGGWVARPGHIPFAECFPWTANLTTTKPEVLKSTETLQQMYGSIGINNDVKVITYCRTGTEASMTYFVLRYLGYDVALYDGSYTEWSKQADTRVAAQ